MESSLSTFAVEDERATELDRAEGETTLEAQGWYKRGGSRPQPGLENDMVMSDPEEEW
jgi:hypothetical protein